jgi:predicted transcriptional regulator
MASVKTAISVDKDLFAKADDLARELGVTRSHLFGLAMEDFIRRRRNKQMFDQLNEAYANGPTPDEEEALEAGLHLYREVLDLDSAQDEQW